MRVPTKLRGYSVSYRSLGISREGTSAEATYSSRWGCCGPLIVDKMEWVFFCHFPQTEHGHTVWSPCLAQYELKTHACTYSMVSMSCTIWTEDVCMHKLCGLHVQHVSCRMEKPSQGSTCMQHAFHFSARATRKQKFILRIIKNKFFKSGNKNCKNCTWRGLGRCLECW